MFKSATVKLTLLYIGLLISICVFFSFNWYRVATHELDAALHRQSSMVELLPNIRGSDAVREIFQEREARLIEGKQNIARQLFGVNVILLILGGLGSYFMAKRTLEPIEVAHQAQARFTADASHELRTPLAAMQTEIEVALRDPALSIDEATTLLRSNLEELAKLGSLADGLLRLARYDTEGGLRLESVSLQSVFHDVYERTAKRAKLRKISVTYQETAAAVLAQPAGIVELLVNLVDNAIKYSPVKSTVQVAVRATKQQVVIRVIDSGVGIAPADIPRVFDRFYRADTSRTHNDATGHGLGLSLAQHIAHGHGTEIKVTSKIGKGSVFSITLQKAQGIAVADDTQP